MRLPPWVLLVAGLVLIGGLLGIAVWAAGGDDGEDASAAVNTPTPGDPGEFGPEPAMTEHIKGITPAHGGTIRQQETVETASGLTGICAEVTYQDLPQNNLSFQMALDGEIVTDRTTVVLTQGTQAAPEGGRICWRGADEPLAIGRHSAAVAVQDPNNLSGPPSEVVGWEFDVIE